MANNGKNGNLAKITAKLDKLADLRDGYEAISTEHAGVINEVFTEAGIAEKLAEINEEFRPRLDSAQAQIDSLTAEIKALAEKHGETVQGEALQAVFSGGRVTWDDKALQGYMAAGHPELADFRKTGKASVSIRPVAAKKE